MQILGQILTVLDETKQSLDEGDAKYEDHRELCSLRLEWAFDMALGLQHGTLALRHLERDQGRLAVPVKADGNGDRFFSAGVVAEAALLLQPAPQVPRSLSQSASLAVQEEAGPRVQVAKLARFFAASHSKGSECLPIRRTLAEQEEFEYRGIGLLLEECQDHVARLSRAVEKLPNSASNESRSFVGVIGEQVVIGMAAVAGRTLWPVVVLVTQVPSTMMQTVLEVPVSCSKILDGVSLPCWLKST
jgi:hypothetical protein